MRLRTGVATHRGLVRTANEDSFFLSRGLYAVCDGMGGARAGEVASEMACRGLMSVDPTSAGEKELQTAVADINRAIVNRSLADEHLLGMGTTLTAVMVKEATLVLAHVGDSRAYLFRDGVLVQLTEDHSWVGEMVRRGELTAEQAAVHPHRSVITRALGTERDVEPDIKEIGVVEGDRLLLCSDGLTGMVSDEEIVALLSAHEAPQAAAEALVKAALAAGGEDNVTAMVIDIAAGDLSEVEESGGDTGSGEALIGPADRGALPGAALHRGKRAGTAVLEHFGRWSPPVLRPVRPRQEGGDTTGEGLPALPTAGGEAAVPGVPPAPRAPPVPGGAPGAAAAVPFRGRRRRRWVLAAILVVVILAAAGGGFAAYNSSVYYVGRYEGGGVALYRGLPGSFLGIELSSVVEVADVNYDLLASYLQGRVDAHELVSKEEGRAFLKALDEQQ